MSLTPSNPCFSLPLSTILGRAVGGNGPRYKLEQKLGQGSFGVVYSARPMEGDGERPCVALKVMRGPYHLSDYEAELSSLTKVAAACASLPHVRVARLVDSFIDDSHGGCCLVTTPVARTDLSKLLSSCPQQDYSLDDALRWTLDIATALSALHRTAKLYHGDVSPRNVLLGHDGHAYLTDYGIAVHNHPYGGAREDLPLAKYSASVAPEMMTGERRFDASADVWSWGVVADALLSRSLARAGSEASRNYFMTLRSFGPRFEAWVKELQLP